MAASLLISAFLAASCAAVSALLAAMLDDSETWLEWRLCTVALEAVEPDMDLAYSLSIHSSLQL